MQEQANLDQSIARSLRTLIRGLTQNDLTDRYQAYKALFQVGPAAIPQVRDAHSQSNWSNVKYGNEIRFVSGLVSLIHDLDESEGVKIANQLRGNGCDLAIARILDSIVSFKLSDYDQYEVVGVKILEHKKLVTKQNVRKKLEQWLDQLPREDLDEIERIYVLRREDLDSLGNYQPILFGINVVWDNPSARWSPMSWVNNFIIESTLYHEIGHHVHRHTFGQDSEQEQAADKYADRMMATRSSHLIFRLARFLSALTNRR